MANNPAMVVRVAASVAELKKNLAEGKVQIETTTAAMQRMATGLSGDKLIQKAHDITAAVQSIGGASILARGQAKSNAAVNFAKLLALAAFAPLAARFGGINALLVAFVLAEVVRYGLTLYAMNSSGHSAAKQELGLTALLLLTNCTACQLIDFHNPLIRSSLQLAFVAVVAAATLAFVKWPISLLARNEIRVPV